MATIYWANAMFSDADRSFNEHCASELRRRGHIVFLPQEASENREAAPSAEAIFNRDTTELLRSDLLVACLDQETIDCGVACEIGVAYAAGIPILSLLTDIRHNRTGAHRIYKNPYVLGAVARAGRVCTSVAMLFSEVDTLASSLLVSGTNPAEHFDRVAHRYDEFIGRLESWYEPDWSASAPVVQALRRLTFARVLEIGSGTGSIAAAVTREFPAVTYIGYDPSRQMLAYAERRAPAARFVATPDDLTAQLCDGPFDVVVSVFSLHDQLDKDEWLRTARSYLRVGGALLVIDLTVLDLPRTTSHLQRTLATPLAGPDMRLHPALLDAAGARAGFDTVRCCLATPAVTFMRAADLLEYLTVFGIHEGNDLPITTRGIGIRVEESLLDQACASFAYPHQDRRAFVVWQATRTQ